MIFDWNWKGANASVARALEIDPSSVPAHTLRASLLSTLGSYEAAVDSCRTALILDPLSFSANLQLASSLFAARQFQDVVTQCWQMLNLSASFAQAQLLLALAYEQLGMYEEAVIEFRNAQRSATCRVAALGGLSELFAITGRPGDSQQAFRELSEQSAIRHVSHFWHALAYCGQGLPDHALANLEKSANDRDPAMLSLNADARFDGLRNSARFISLLKKAGIED
jgi:Tfp pilus assembly protein PilF